VLRNAESEGFSASEAGGIEFNLLTDEAELAVIKRMAAFPRLLEAAALAHEPHRISFYLYELASDFHALWNKGKEAPHLRFIIPAQRQLTMTRMAFLRTIRYSLANGLSILGVRPVEEM
jgi:arginyl-tRNA synthetase